MKNATKIFSIFIGVLFIGSVFLYSVAYQPAEPKGKIPEKDFTVNEHDFYITPQGYYRTLIRPETGGKPMSIDFRLDPRNASQIPINEQVNSMIDSASKIYLTYNPNMDNFTQISGFMNQAMSTTSIGISLTRPDLVNQQRNYIIAAQTEDIPETDSDDTYPIKTCANSTEQALVIKFQPREPARIYKKDKCIIVQGPAEDLIQSTDRLNMKLLNINVE